MSSSASRGHSQSKLPEIRQRNNYCSRCDCNRSRSQSPGRLLMQVHDRLIEESHKKDCLASDLISLKRRIEEFSIRLDFILKCMCEINLKEPT
jgi:hypothetical protein